MTHSSYTHTRAPNHFCALVTGDADAGYGAVILEALAITGVVFLSLSLFACQTRVDFTIYSGLLTSLLVSLIVWGFFCSLFGFSTNGLYSWLGTLIFSGYVVVDTQRIMHKFGVDDYIIAAIELCELFSASSCIRAYADPASACSPSFD